MVITREIRDEIRNSVSTSINSVLKEEAFIKLIVEKVSDSLTKTLGEKIGELEQKINETNKKCVENSTVIEELKEETAVLKSENEYLLRKSLFTGFQEFKEIVLENDIDIMLLSETWLGPDDHSVVVDIPGYTLFRKDRVVCVRKNPMAQNATFSEVENTIKVSLQNAPDREGGRANKENPK
ncbi:hypothetical protein JTB14_014327 [Gonioctena quinquepunctata]|nr:hypothetical protein JTB14_014327 [Gonioctena quinquepunctata]